MTINRLIIHMNNGDQYELNNNEDFDRRSQLTVKEMSGYITREIAEGGKTLTFNSKGTDIKYVSRFAIYNVDQVTIALDSISSFEFVEGISDVKRRKV